MRKFLLLGLILALPIVSFAKEPYQRSSAGRVKQINTAGHSLTANSLKSQRASNKLPKAAEAPQNALEVPVNHTLGKNEPDNIALYTTIDANNDGNTWKVGGFTGYSVCLTSSTAVIDGSDDWMVTPPVHLLANKEYTFKYEEACATASSKGGKLEVKYGKEPTVAGMDKVIFSDPEHSLDSNTFKENSNNFTVTEDGYYYFGFHAYSPKGSSAKVCNLSITEASAKVDPPAAGVLSYTLAPKGELKGTISYITPTKTASGKDLSKISKVVVTVNWGLTVKEFADVTPGEKIEFETELWHGGNNKVEAVAYLDATAGESVSITNFYCGPDNPLPPTNAKIALSDDYKKVTVSWDPVGEVGENGGYVDIDNVTYYIFDAFGSYYDDAIASTSQTSYTFDYSDLKEQDFVAYQITAGVGEDFYSLPTTTDIVLAGTPEKLPFGESFTNAGYDQIWAIDPETTSQGWYVGTVKDNELQTNAADEEATPTYLNSQDGDNGFFMAMPMIKDAVYGIQSGKIDISTAAKPVAEFWAQGKGSNIEVNVAKESGAFEVVKTIKFKEEPTNDWTLYRIDLSDYKSAKYIRLALRYIAVDNTETESWSIPLDNIRIRDLADTDLRLFYPAITKSVKAGEPAIASARIENLGTKECTGATVELYTGGKLLEAKGIGALAADSFTTISFSIPTNAATPEKVSAEMKIVCNGDAVESNNSSTVTFAVIQSKYPTVSGLAGNVNDNGVELTWDAIDIDGNRTPVDITEDFEDESYTPLTISDFGNWTLFDGDKSKTYNILQETNNEYQTQPQAFQLYNPVLAGVPDNYLIDAQPHSGSQFLVAWSAAGGQNDNWLISPELSNEEQTISFFAKSFSLTWPESFEVLYSTTDKQIENFVKVDAVENYPESNVVPEEWTEFKATLPVGAKYFAIHHNSYDSGALYVDDISFTAAPQIPTDLSIVGYNVYRDGAKINTAVITETQMTDNIFSAETPAGEYKFNYQVSPVFNYEEGRACDAVEVTIQHVSVDKVSVESNAAAKYYNLQGIEVSKDNLTPGLYLKACGSKTEKVIIK